MMKLKLLSVLILGGTLAACGGSGSSSGGGGSSSSDGGSTSSVGGTSSASSSSDANCGPFGCIDPDPSTALNTQSPTFPFHETFDVPANEGNQAALFFSTEYLPLYSAELEQTATFPDGSAYEDPHPSFYYPTCCLWETDSATGELTGNLIPDLDQRQFVGKDSEGKGYYAISSARFSIGQLRPDIVDKNYVVNDVLYAKSQTSDIPAETSWGELDLSKPYSVSFCLRDAGLAGSGTGGNLEVFVDNNSGGNQDRSIHGIDSMLLRTPAAGLQAGNRVVIDIPGDARLVDNDGNPVGSILSTTVTTVGTEKSYLQIRVASGGYAVFSDLIIEYQDDRLSNKPVCTADSTLFDPPEFEGVPFVSLPLDVNLNVSKDDFFGDGGSTSFLAFPGDITTAFYSGTMGKGRFILADGVARFGNSNWTVGNRHIGDTTAGDTLESLTGGLDLSEPFRIVMQIDSLTDLVAHPDAQFNIAIDNNTSNAGNSIHGANDTLLNVRHDALAIGELIVNVPGEITLNGEVIGTIAEHVGTERSFLRFRCPANCGAAEEDNNLGIGLSGILIELQEEVIAEPLLESWELDLATIAEDDPLVHWYGGEANIVDGALVLNNARFTVGVLPAFVVAEATTTNGADVGGRLDVEGPYRITIEYSAAVGGVFMVLSDNNTTSQANSYHDHDSRTIRASVGGTNTPETGFFDLNPEGGTIVYDSYRAYKENGGFFQFRAESGSTINITAIKFEKL